MVELEIGLLKAYLGVSTQDYERVRDFQLRCLTQPINEINKANIGIEISYSSIKIKKKIVAFRFECKDVSEIKDKLKITKTDTFEEKQEKQAILSEEEFFKKHEKELELIHMGLQALASELELKDGGFSLNVKAKTELIKKHQDEWDKIH